MKRSGGWLVLVLGTLILVYAATSRRAIVDPVGRVSNQKSNAKPTMGQQMFEWRMLPWRDQNGDIPEGAIPAALQARDEYLQSNIDSSGFEELGSGLRFSRFSY